MRSFGRVKTTPREQQTSEKPNALVFSSSLPYCDISLCPGDCAERQGNKAAEFNHAEKTFAAAFNLPQ